MISVLVPSRERPELLARSIASLGEGDIEVLVRVDDDDPRLDEYREFPGLIVGPHHGYPGLHHYYNELAERARGDWLFLWNDDGIMETPNWIDIVRAFDGKLVVLNPTTNHNNWEIDMNVFPIVPRKMVELMGHFSLSNHNDSWMEFVGRDAGIQVRVPISIHHDRADLTGNNDDGVYSRRHLTNDHFKTDPEMVRLRARDVEAIREYLARNDAARLELTDLPAAAEDAR
jgi:glycosyltransferase involved in cell wall biosynthesis